MRVDIKRLRTTRHMLAAKMHAVGDGLLQDALEQALEIIDPMLHILELGGEAIYGVKEETNDQ